MKKVVIVLLIALMLSAVSVAGFAEGDKPFAGTTLTVDVEGGELVIR